MRNGNVPIDEQCGWLGWTNMLNSNGLNDEQLVGLEWTSSKGINVYNAYA